jgi:hypothetical protein
MRVISCPLNSVNRRLPCLWCDGRSGEDMLICRVGLAYIGAKFREFIGYWIILRRCSIFQTRLCATPNGRMFANDELVIVQKEEAGVLTRYRSVSLLGSGKIARNTETVLCIHQVSYLDDPKREAAMLTNIFSSI